MRNNGHLKESWTFCTRERPLTFQLHGCELYLSVRVFAADPPRHPPNRLHRCRRRRQSCGAVVNDVDVVVVVTVFGPTGSLRLRRPHQHIFWHDNVDNDTDDDDNVEETVAPPPPSRPPATPPNHYAAAHIAPASSNSKASEPHTAHPLPLSSSFSSSHVRLRLSHVAHIKTA